MSIGLSLEEYIAQHYVSDESTFREPGPVFYTSEVSFVDGLQEYIESRFRKDSLFYEKANISRQAFYKMKTTKDYSPTKSTAFACLIALELNLEESASLLRKAGMTFSRSSLMDIIVRYYIENGEYDLDRINEVLDGYGQPTLGSR